MLLFLLLVKKQTKIKDSLGPTLLSSYHPNFPAPLGYAAAEMAPGNPHTWHSYCVVSSRTVSMWPTENSRNDGMTSKARPQKMF